MSGAILSNVRVSNAVTSSTLVRSDYKSWFGNANPSAQIGANQTEKFDHLADRAGGSIAGLAYVVENQGKKYTWVFAWSNSGENRNRVYTQILDGHVRVDWDHVKDRLEACGNVSEGIYGDIMAKVLITQESTTPQLSATINKLP